MHNKYKLLKHVLTDAELPDAAQRNVPAGVNATTLCVKNLQGKQLTTHYLTKDVAHTLHVPRGT